MMQFAYGLATSTEVAYFTYIYAKISGQYYRQVCSCSCSCSYSCSCR